MLIASENIMQEEWVLRWLDKLTPQQKTLVAEVLTDSNKPRNPTPAAVAEADAAINNFSSTALVISFPEKSSNSPHLADAAR